MGTKVMRIYALLLFMLLSSCVPGTPIKQFQAHSPVISKGQSGPIMFKKIISKIRRGQEIGTSQRGILCIPKGKVFWKRGGYVNFGDAELGDTLREELTQAGYSVIGDPSSLFENPQEWKAEYLIGGIIKHVAINVCYPFSGFQDFTTSSGEASIEVEWKLFERRTRLVVFSATIGGTGKTGQGPHMGIQAYYDAFAQSVRNLLANNRFVNLVSRSSPVVAQEKAATIAMNILELEQKELKGSSSDLIEYAQKTVVTIPIGSGHGSGVLVSTSGLVLTNAHVVGKGSGPVTVELATGRRVAGEVIKFNDVIDVALIKLEKGKYFAAPIGSSESLKVGDTVFAIGAPLAERFSRTVTRGVVSAFRVVEGRRQIQSDAQIHPGNSGGPLLDAKGQVVGLAQSGVMLGRIAGIGMNFFVPIDDAWRALKVEPKAYKISYQELISGMRSAATPSKEPRVARGGTEEKLRLLQELRQKGLITDSEAQQRRKDILDQAFP